MSSILTYVLFLFLRKKKKKTFAALNQLIVQVVVVSIWQCFAVYEIFSSAVTYALASFDETLLKSDDPHFCAPLKCQYTKFVISAIKVRKHGQIEKKLVRLMTTSICLHS